MLEFASRCPGLRLRAATVAPLDCLLMRMPSAARNARTMRKKSKPIRRPANLAQFRGYRPRRRRQKPYRRNGPLRIAAVGLLAGALLGLGVSYSTGAGLPSLPIAAADETPLLCIADVHDGDTIRTCEGERIRIENIDAPELAGSPKCTDSRRQGWCDYNLAARSRDELASFLDSGPVTISRSGTDTYGRTLAALAVEGEDAGDHLVSMGLARVWQ